MSPASSFPTEQFSSSKPFPEILGLYMIIISLYHCYVVTYVYDLCILFTGKTTKQTIKD